MTFKDLEKWEQEGIIDSLKPGENPYVEYTKDDIIACLKKENQELKKQFKELKSTNSVLANELTKDTIIKQKYLTTCCGIPIGDIPKLKFKQKEFIEWLENEIQKQKEN